MYFDIGANVGLWAIKNVNSADKIISVEASPITYNRLCSNVKDYSQIVPLCYAVCDSTEDVEFFHCTGADTISTLNEEWLSSEKSRFYNFQYVKLKVKTISIDKLIEQYGMPDLIKVDVEGAESQCVRSLTQKTPRLCFEWASELGEDAMKALDHLHSLGYTCYHMEQNKDDYTYRPDSYPMTILDVKSYIAQSRPKHDWGMIWCK